MGFGVHHFVRAATENRRRCSLCVPAHWHAAVGSESLGQLRLAVDVNGLGRLQRRLADLPIVQEAGDLQRSHQELELVPLPVVQSL